MVKHQYSALLYFVFICLVRAGALRRILLSNVETLTFRDGRLTSGRRHEPIPQLQCTNCDEFWPEEVKCFNRGKAGTNDVTWRCETKLPQQLSLGKTVVQCEGYDYPEDPYVLESSCGLVFELKGNPSHYQHNKRGYWREHHYEEPGMNGLKSFIIFIIVCIVAYNLFCKTGSTNAAPSGANTHRYGGGDLGGGGYPDGVPYQAQNSWGSGTSWPSNFWTGMGLGGGLAYLFSRRRPTYSRPTFQDTPGFYGYRSGFSGGSRTRTSNSSYTGTSSLRSSSSSATTSRR